MTGWKTDDKTTEFVESLLDQIESHPELMPDAFYWLSMKVDIDLESQGNTHGPSFDESQLDWLKRNPKYVDRYLKSYTRAEGYHRKRLDEIDVRIKQLKRLENE